MIGYPKTSQLTDNRDKRSQAKKNADSNKKLDAIYKPLGLYDICEVRVVKNCLKIAKTTRSGTELKMTYAHKEKRDWYKEKGREKLLHSFEHTVRACIPCHMKIESNRAITLKVFKRLRPNKK